MYLKLKQKFKEDKALIFLIITSVFIFGLIAHAYSYLNPIFSHDSLVSLCQLNDIGFKISLGRYVQPIFMMFRGLIVVPWLIGILSLLYISIATYFIVKMLEIKNNIIIIAFCGILTTNISITLTNATYMQESDMFMLSLALASLSVYILRVFKLGCIWGVIPLVLAVGLYQAFYQSAIAIIMILFVKDIFDNKNKEAYIHLIKGGAMVIAGVLIYYLLNLLVLQMSGIHPSDGYNSMDTGRFLSSSPIILKYIAHRTIEKIIPCKSLISGNYFAISSVFNLVFFATIFIVFVTVLKSLKINTYCKILFVSIIGLMPWCINSVLFLTKNVIHDLMEYSVFFIFILALYILDYNRNRTLNIIAFIAMSAILLGNIVFANKLYLKKDFEYHSTLSFITRVIDRIEQTDGYIPGESKVLFLGHFNDSPTLQSRPGFENVVGVGTSFNSSYSITYSAPPYFKYILGYNIVIVREKDIIDDFSNRLEVQLMPRFPAMESVKKIDDVIVVNI